MQKAFNTKHKALEMTMRDVMDNLEDTSSYLALSFSNGFEILSIEAPSSDPLNSQQLAEIHQLPESIQEKYA